MSAVALLPALLLGGLVGIGVTQLRASRTYQVAKPSENIRTAPEGRQIGTLLQGATIEEAGRDGRWVKFHLEAWVWGPSLDGFEAQEAARISDGDLDEEDRSLSSISDDRAPARLEKERRPRVAVNVHLDEVRELIDDRFGRFYGIRRDPDLNQVQIRFRVTKIDPEALELRHMRVQHAVLALLAEDVEFETLRIETNRADGTGEVGIEQSVTSVADIRRLEGKDPVQWRQITRRSSDGGKNWVGP
jgi:hypothetical protein